MVHWTGAALDSLTHRCHIVETRGESFRLHDSKRRRNRTAKALSPELPINRSTNLLNGDLRQTIDRIRPPAPHFQPPSKWGWKRTPDHIIRK